MKRSSWFALGVLVTWLVAAFLAPWQSEQINLIELEEILAEPGAGAALGRDDLGRSLAVRVLAGARVSFAVAVVVVVISATIGIFIGLAGAWSGGWVDRAVVQIINVFLAFPGILLAIAVAGILGPGLINLVLSLSAVGWVGFARLTRAQTLSIRQRDHVTVGKALGTRAPTILLRHVLPLMAGPLIVEASFALAAVIVAEAGLSFLGLGIQAPDPSWGSMIRDGTRYLLVAPHFVLVPGLALMSVVVAINLAGDRLRDYWSDRSSAPASSVYSADEIQSGA